MAFNLILEFCVVRHNHSWQYWPIPEIVEHQRHSTWNLFSWQNRPLGKELPIPQLLTNTRYPEMDNQNCQILPRQGKTVLKIFLPLKMVCQLFYTLAKVGCFNIANKILGDCPGSQLSLSFVAHFGSCLIALPAYSSNIISLLRNQCGWRLDSCSYFPLITWPSYL